MTNMEIIFRQSVKLMNDGIIGTTGRTITMENSDGTKTEIMEPEPIHTFAAWKSAGYAVKKGSKAVASFMIWKHVTKTATVDMLHEDGTTSPEDIDISNMFMKKASFFTAAQVEKITA